MTDYPLTFKCNNNCISCINKTRYFSKIPNPKKTDIKNLIKKLDPENDYWGVGGGEPTLRKEFFEILKYVKKYNPRLYVFITTNGRMFRYKKFTKKLKDLNLENFMVGISLYGQNKKIHEEITRTSGSFEQTVLGIKNLIYFDIPVEVRIIINRINYKYLEDITDFVIDNFAGIERLVFINMKYTGNALVNKEKVLVKVKDVVPFVKKSIEKIRNKKINMRLYHFPLCILPNNIRDIAKGVTKMEKNELVFVKACKKCKLKSECPKIWKSYVDIVGDSEFRPIL